MRLGELEKQVLNYFWQVDEADAKTVYEHFEPIRGGSLNTIQSTLDRLYKKHLLLRNKSGHAFRYQAAADRKAFIGQLIRQVTEDFTGDDHESLLSAFVSLTAELDESHLDRLEQEIVALREQTAVKEPEE